MNALRVLFLFSLTLAATACNCGPPNRPEGTSCINSTFCNEKLVCHPVAQLCMKACDSVKDCPDTQKECAAYPDGAGGMTPRFCQCATTPDCKDEKKVCGSEKICLPKCTSNVDCTHGRLCNKSSGLCG